MSQHSQIFERFDSEAARKISVAAVVHTFSQSKAQASGFAVPACRRASATGCCSSLFRDLLRAYIHFYLHKFRERD